ncbi:MAG: alpha-amylase family glycosyl hydrolase [Cytophagales bacterium]|nr:alpha-amylase family glycosyl hydrolase [Cytophagales bacterium]MDW8383508.1 alpha-amylase family glycosyl hydrolase [Flammeovirgaceae bacterium]
MASLELKPTRELKLLKEDPWLAPYEHDIAYRLKNYYNVESALLSYFNGWDGLTLAHQYFGVHYDKSLQGWWIREWAPGAKSIHLAGDFNEWNFTSHPFTKKEKGVWEIFLDAKTHQLKTGSRYKIRVHGADDSIIDRLPAYTTYALQDDRTKIFDAAFWLPEEPFDWSGDDFDITTLGTPYIYECHVGMAQEKEGVGTYQEFADNILPRIKALGYNAIQLMAIQEHPYYGSFGYHVSNFFAPSSRFGTPHDLKSLIKKAHSMGIAVIMDIVHSHAVKNVVEGLNRFDGTDYQYFHAGERGNHSGWDSKLFNYGKWEVIQFLLSNVRYWIEEFHFDGFRFDGVTSMMYTHHGFTAFDHYDKYFKYDIDTEAITYLQLANTVAHKYKPGCITIAEDVSGMPGLGLPISEGGIGFDYRLAMGIPDYWIKLLKHVRDEDWNIYEIWHTLSNRRWNEKHIAYAESHDQALVGDKTIAFWLMDKEMYWYMRESDQNIIIDRGIALHKIIRLLTATLGGEGYLNFMGNEFGHPEWIDFPREGNGWSYKYARRQWSLVDNPNLKYKYLNAWDKAMIDVLKKNNVLSSWHAREINMDEYNKTIIAERNNLIFIFNLHPTHSIFDYQFTPPQPGKYKIILNSDHADFGGFHRIDDTMTYQTDEQGKLHLYITNRTALVLKKIR